MFSKKGPFGKQNPANGISAYLKNFITGESLDLISFSCQTNHMTIYDPQILSNPSSIGKIVKVALKLMENYSVSNSSQGCYGQKILRQISKSSRTNVVVVE